MFSNLMSKLAGGGANAPTIEHEEFARAVKENGGGTAHHVVWDEGLSKEARIHLQKLGYADLVEYHVAEAVETLQSLPGPFDLIFNDINKEGYPASLPVIKEKLRPGGVLITDNILWSGRIFDEKDQSPSTEGVREFTRLISQDRDWIVSVGDCFDNAMCESFFASLECELLDRRGFQTHAEARIAVFRYIEGWYNPHRRHSALDYQSPVNYERRKLAAA